MVNSQDSIITATNDNTNCHRYYWGRFARPSPFEKRSCERRACEVLQTFADFMRRTCEKLNPKTLFENDSLTANSAKVMRKRPPKNIENPFQFESKLDEKRVRRHPEAAKSTNEATNPDFFNFLSLPGRLRDYGFHPFWLQNCRNIAAKNQSKNG